MVAMAWLPFVVKNMSLTEDLGVVMEDVVVTLFSL
ncbi:Uncharacterised protein [Mycobacteroides abscessus subsp. abscessus]|nr:Uncharacterised protein [Mycobacteroides abscessus subsp. abscessus]